MMASPHIFRSSVCGSLVKTKLGLLGGSLPDSRGAEKGDVFFFFFQWRAPADLLRKGRWRVRFVKMGGESRLHTKVSISL